MTFRLEIIKYRGYLPSRLWIPSREKFVGFTIVFPKISQQPHKYGGHNKMYLLTFSDIMCLKLK